MKNDAAVFPVADVKVAPYVPGRGYGPLTDVTDLLVKGEPYPPREVDAEYNIITQPEHEPVNNDPYLPALPIVDHHGQAGLAAEIESLTRDLRDVPRDGMKHRRAGITKNKGQKRSKARARMAHESRRRNR